MSNIKKRNIWTIEEVHTKNKFTQWCSHILTSILTSSMKVTKIHFEGFWWWSYVPSKLTSISVNLIMWIYFLWTSSIVQVLVFFTFDIFLTTWHLSTFLSPAYVVWGKVIISHLSLCSQGGTLSSWGYLSWLGGYLLWPGRYLTWLGYLHLLGVLTLARWLPTFVKG